MSRAVGAGPEAGGSSGPPDVTSGLQKGTSGHSAVPDLLAQSPAHGDDGRMETRLAPPGETGPEDEPSWRLILLAGGAGWFVVAMTAVLWLWPMSGTRVGDQYYLSSPGRIVQHLMVFLLAVPCYRISYSARAPSWRERPVAYVALQVVLALCVVRLAPYAAGLSAGLVDQRWQDLTDTYRYWAPFTPHFRSWTVPMQFFLPPYLLGMAVIGLVVSARNYHRESIRSAQLWAAYAEARLSMLSAQLQPHFLFNAMHAIGELINESPERATVMLARLGDFLRHALESARQPWVSVRTEVSGLEAYLAVQQARFRDSLQVEMTIDPAVQNCSMPAMLLQPLVENAVEHGRMGSGVLRVGVAVALEGGRIVATVRNSTPHLASVLPAGAYGTGLSNVAARLRAAYDDGATLAVGPDPEGGTLARLELPVRSQQ
jgi:hypothetical protein